MNIAKFPSRDLSLQKQLIAKSGHYDPKLTTRRYLGDEREPRAFSLKRRSKRLVYWFLIPS
ncbi:MAG: hypothetical protein QM796_22195 [Chthoniobacteraceae bacterium]